MKQCKKICWILSLTMTVLLAAVLCACAGQPAGQSDMRELVDAPKGYAVRIPSDMEVDFSLAQSYTKCVNSEMELFISRETSPYDDILYYLDHYFDRYVTTPGYQEVNNISLHCHKVDEINGWKAKLLSVTRNPYLAARIGISRNGKQNCSPLREIPIRAAR